MFRLRDFFVAGSARGGYDLTGQCGGPPRDGRPAVSGGDRGGGLAGELEVQALGGGGAARRPYGEFLACPPVLHPLRQRSLGSSNAGDLLSDSNVDWGQNLIRLTDYLKEHHPKEPVWVLYFGQVPTDGYGLTTRDMSLAKR